MQLFSLVFSIICLIFSIYTLYSCLVRFLKIKNLQEEILNNNDKQIYLKKLYKYCLISSIFVFSIILFILFNVLELRLLSSTISSLICGNILWSLTDEIEDFDIKKKDAEILLDFIKRRNKEADELIKENKIKKIDSIDKTKTDDLDLNKKKET